MVPALEYSQGRGEIIGLLRMLSLKVHNEAGSEKKNNTKTLKTETNYVIAGVILAETGNNKQRWTLLHTSISVSLQCLLVIESTRHAVNKGERKLAESQSLSPSKSFGTERQ